MGFQYVVLEPGQHIKDMRDNTQVIAIITPNRATPSSGGGSVQLAVFLSTGKQTIKQVFPGTDSTMIAP